MESKERSGYELFTILIFGLLFGFGVMLLKAIIILDFIRWFNIPVALTYYQVVGILMVIYVITIKLTKNKDIEKESTATVISNWFTYLFLVLLIWGIGYIYYLILM